MLGHSDSGAPAIALGRFHRDRVTHIFLAAAVGECYAAFTRLKAIRSFSWSCSAAKLGAELSACLPAAMLEPVQCRDPRGSSDSYHPAAAGGSNGVLGWLLVSLMLQLSGSCCGRCAGASMWQLRLTGIELQADMLQGVAISTRAASHAAALSTSAVNVTGSAADKLQAADWPATRAAC